MQVKQVVSDARSPPLCAHTSLSHVISHEWHSEYDTQLSTSNQQASCNAIHGVKLVLLCTKYRVKGVLCQAVKCIGA